MEDWRDIPELAGINVEDSWVLAWAYDEAAGTLRIAVEASLGQNHPAYTPPRAGEWTCYRRGTLLFRCVHVIEGLRPLSEARPNVDLDGSKDFGVIEGLTREGDHYRFGGQMGDVKLRASALALTLDEGNAPAV